MPRAVNFAVELGEERCPVCGERRKVLVGSGSCEIHGGTSWMDAIGIASWPLFLVSRRVVVALEQIGAKGFEPRAVCFTKVQSPAMQNAPDYFYLDVKGRIDIDLKSSGLEGAQQCPGCFRDLSTKLIEPTRYVPAREGWDGSDLFRLRNRPNLLVFCTRRILELARQERWTNFRFEPMDVVQRHAVSWSGIDYLGEQWPPAKWYPDAPGAGKSIAELVGQLCNEPHPQYVAAYRALIELGRDAVPYVAPLLDDVSATTRKRAARVLAVIHSRSDPLPADLKNKAREILVGDKDFLSALDER